MPTSVAKKNHIGFALVSSNRNRILFFHTDYERTKRIQLYYMRNDLLYLFPVNAFMLQKHTLQARRDSSLVEFTDKTCIRFTTSNASILQVEMDIAPFRLKNMRVYQHTKPSADEYNIHANLCYASEIIEQVEIACQNRLKHLEDKFEYVLKGYEMFHSFCVENFGESRNIDSMFKHDINDEVQFVDAVNSVKREINNAIMSMDFTADTFKEELKQTLTEIRQRDINQQSELIFRLITLQ